MNTQKTPTRYHTIILLLIILTFGATLRFWGIEYDLPYVFNPDEAYIMDRAVAVADGNLRHGVIFRGSLPYYITGGSIRLTKFFYPKLKQGYATFQESYVKDKTPFYIIGRAIVATYSVLTTIILYLLARALFNETIGLLSVFIFSLNMLEIQYAHQIYSDTALSFFMLFTLYILLIAFKRKNHVLIFISAILIGLSTAQKLPGILLLPFCIFLYRKILVSQHVPLRSQIYRYLLLTGIVVVVYIVSYPFVFSELSELPIKWIKDTEPNFYQLAILQAPYTEKIRDYTLWLRDGSGSVMLLMMFIGVYRVLRKNLFLSNIVLNFALGFLLFIAIGKAHWDNYILPILPITSLLAAVGFYTLYRGAVAYSRRKLFGLFLITLLLYPATIKAVWTTRSYTQPDTRSLEIQWLKAHHVDNSRVVRDGYTSIGIPPDTLLLSKLTTEQLQQFDYFVLSSWYSPNFSDTRRHTENLAAFYETIKTRYSKIVEFIAGENPMYIDDLPILSGNYRKHINLIRGPTISIYSVHPAKRFLLF